MMDDKEFEKYLKDRYGYEMNWYDRKAVSNRLAYMILQWGLITLAALTPVLVALGEKGIDPYVPIVVSSLVAIGTAALKTFKYQENWINYRTTCETLRKEIHLLHAGIGDYADADDPRQVFVQRVESLISRENTLWLTVQKQEQKQSERGQT